MRILVTGGAGFIGSHIVDAYINDGHEVAVVDDLSAGDKSFVNENAHFFNCKIQSSALETVFADFKPNIVNHHAAHINLRQSVIDPIYDADNNIIGTLNILGNSVKYNTGKIIFSSTGGAIYGEPELLPVSENQTPEPLSPYGAAKLSVEHYIRIWHLVHGIEYVVFRYPNVYGPRQNPKGEAGVVAIFSLQMLNNKTPTIFGDGSKTRDYLYVSDVVDANISALHIGVNQTLNLGWGKEISDQMVFDCVAKSLDYKQKPGYSLIRPGEVNRIALNSKRAQTLLKWSPRVTFPEGVTRAVRYYIEQKEKY
jgi:UDP-glucose 4-epimerase